MSSVTEKITSDTEYNRSNLNPTFDNVKINRYLSLGKTYHAYGGFQDESETIAIKA